MKTLQNILKSTGVNSYQKSKDKRKKSPLRGY